MKNQDILKDLEHLALASRLRRLADNLLADSAKIHLESGEPLQPGQFPLIAALNRYGPMTVGDAVSVLGISQPATTRAVAEAVKTGLVSSRPSESDKRYRELALTKLGQESVARMKQVMWPRVAMAARDLTKELSVDFLDAIAKIEHRLSKKSLLERVRENGLSILHYSDGLAAHFHDINMEWLQEMFSIEPHDSELLENPKRTIIDKGGCIFFVRDQENTIIGTCALKREENGYIELTKMGVRRLSRSQGAGEFLLRAVLDYARELDWHKKLFLVGNSRSEHAIKLYEKLGFVHDAEIMARFGNQYERCNVAMSYKPKPK